MTPTRWTSPDGRRWTLRAGDPVVAHEICAALGMPPALGQVLSGRGYDVARATELLDPDVVVDHDPMLLRGIDRALPRIRAAIAAGEHVRLVTDYDVDGTMSCLVLHAALDRLVATGGGAAQVSYHVPDRFKEGYGLSAFAVDAAARDGVGLLVTADIGVRDHASVARAAGHGIDVIVVDHHLPAGESVPPDALAVLCPPQEGCAYPNKALAACGVAYKLACALLEADPHRARILASLRKLVAIGTVADVVDLGTPENRSLLRRGLATLNEGGHSPGLAALLEVARNEDGPITAATLGWRIGPRINAAGRLEDANAVVRLLRERDPARAQAQARTLDRLNSERQDIQLGLYEQALAAIPDPLPGFVVVAGAEAEGWHRGVVGIVASKLRERVNRPVAVVSVLPGGVATGSVRSVPSVHAVRALDACADLFHRYGGHAAAAGFSLDAARLPALMARLAAWVDSHHDAADLAGDEPVDLVLEGRALTMPLVRALEALEPTGKGMESPRIAIRGPFTDMRVTGGKHLFFRAAGASCVWWNGAASAENLHASDVVLGVAEVNAWRGEVSARLRVEATGAPA